MNATRLRKLAPRVLLALLALAVMGVLLGINEAGFTRSQRAVEALARTHATRAALDQLLQSMLNAETGQRGYLLTGDERYLRPYESAVASINTHLQTLRDAYARQSDEPDAFGQLSQLVARKLSEMQLTIRLRREDKDDVWRFVLSTDVGEQDMNAIRAVATQLLERNAEHAQHSAERIHRSLNLSRAGIAIAAALGLLVLFLYLRNARALQAAHLREQQVLERERDRLEQLVRERTATLSELAHHLQQVREDERAHLARELHDELGALLTAAKLDVARLKSRIDMDNPDNVERLQHLNDSLNSGIALKRRIIEDLRPSSLSNLGLTTTLEILTSEFARRSGIQVQTQLEPVSLSESAQLTTYRLVQEALTNIHKHAGADQVLVSLHAHAGQVSVQVRDNGQGFDAARPSSASHGLTGMRHRVEAEGGRLNVRSVPGEGTLVSATLPRVEPASAA
ncbi:Signal transduction histidine kinase [Oryzisolibacter propanilivorax]|uniref:Oxygen sensor histidine kinase NreB n=1 Tax=Oryzisolibacter propanilivorax TaxID=1527607 RepID=A0A1G9RLH9_9BURK|nr:CHASE3 domain-containing protein [Oryzisolibacter propanilivorax]SDM23275.1 Signal transduction histidine kinase [Oryzisolibacter propanilivorax]